MDDGSNYAFIGVDVHKEQHTAVVIDWWTRVLGEFTFESKISVYPEFIKELKKKIPENLNLIFGLEDVGGNGRSLAVFLKENGYIVKEVNPSYSSSERKSYPTTLKNDTWDAKCIAEVLVKKVDILKEANPSDLYWTLKQFVYRRDSIVKSLSITKIQLHEQLTKSYTSYKKFFAEIEGKTALAFWEKYPSPSKLKNITTKELKEFLLEASNNSCSTKKAESILSFIAGDGDTFREYQEHRDELVRSYVRYIRFCREEIEELEIHMKKIISKLDYKLETLTGVGIVTASQIIAEIGDINRFESADKLAKYAGVAPTNFSSAGKGRDVKSKQGNRRLNGVLFLLAKQQVQLTKNTGKPRNPILYDYYLRKTGEKKSKSKVPALICIMRRLVNIIYGMMKNKTEYVMEYR
ncbi:IS110 family transposase [Clostridium sp. HBUAS56017]|uniref:IS110 family transposase n=1 Tax=Clostridium sp. HBUAS56017 TaxID=2571128 RepID=UPI00117783A2|nr:IS110 family transposase [Clostridium sp. HBUAS56017]